MFLVSLLLMPPLRAELAVQLGDIQAAGWQARGVRLSLADAAPGTYALQLQVDSLELAAGPGPWRKLRLDCPALRLADGYHCEAATLQAEGPDGSQQLAGEFHYRDAEHWQLSFGGMRLASTRWQIRARADGDWQVAVTGRGAALSGLLALLPAGDLPAWDWQGRVDARLSLQGRGGEARAVDVSLALADIAYGSADGLQAAEGGVAKVGLQAWPAGKGWQGKGWLQVAGGQWYSDPVFLDLSQQPLRLDLAGHWQPANQGLVLTEASARLGKLLQARGKGVVWPEHAADWQAQLEAGDLARLYPALLQPLAYGGPFGNLDLAGSGRLDVNWRGRGPSAVGLVLDKVHLYDQQGRFGVNGLEGNIAWQAAAETQPARASRLSWQAGNLYRVDFGAGSAHLQLQGDQLRLTRPLDLPLLAGKLRIPMLQMAGLRSDRVTWRTALEANALSLPDLTAALGWPSFNGTLSVQVPAVNYAAGQVTLDGELVAEAFDGTVRIKDLQLSEPLGTVPELRAEVSLRGLELERLTRVFNFGQITGRLDGDMQGLHLVGWQPVGFQLELRTPAGDTSKHRISQRAVENLTALGNSGAVALSGTFLRFFESFSYDRLQLKVDLSGQLAELDGIAHPDGGYYLVKGAGLPRIDVIGRNRRVAWRDLVARLKRISLEGMQMR